MIGRYVIAGVVGGILVIGLTALAHASQEHAQEAAITRWYSNVKWSAERNALVGANLLITRRGDQVSGTYVLFDGSEQGTSYRLTGTAHDAHLRFTVRAAGMTLRFDGRMTEKELTGRMIITRPDGTRQEQEFKARRLWR